MIVLVMVKTAFFLLLEFDNLVLEVALVPVKVHIDRRKGHLMVLSILILLLNLVIKFENLNCLQLVNVYQLLSKLCLVVLHNEH